MMVLSIQFEPVRIESGNITMEGMLWLPEERAGVVLFSGGGGSRLNPPSDYIASVLRNARLGTLWLNLLLPQESDNPGDIDILTERLKTACDWLRQHDATHELPIGLFGTNHHAAAVLQLAAVYGHGISAVVLRGARTDLAGHDTLSKISAPTLLIVGGLDEDMVDINRAAYLALHCKKRLEIVPGATHSFDEPGSPEVVARLARGWFLQHAGATHT